MLRDICEVVDAEGEHHENGCSIPWAVPGVEFPVDDNARLLDKFELPDAFIL